MTDHAPLTDEELAALDQWAFENQAGDVAELVGEVARLRAEVERLRADHAPLTDAP